MNILEQHICETLKQTYESSSFNTGYPRHKSWECCHKVFLKLHKKEEELNDDDYEYLALHLAFYLASYGMYRGSCPLLQSNYKIHIEVVKEVMKKDYELLWDYDPTKIKPSKVYDLLFGIKGKKGIYQIIEDIYSKTFIDKEYLSENEGNKVSIKKVRKKPTATLITKILLGTFACIPAFDTFFKEAYKKYKDGEKKSKNTNPSKAFTSLCDFVIKYYWELQFKCPDIYYPPMKVLDLYFWRVGYGLSLIDKLSGSCSLKIEKTLIEEKFFNDKSDLAKYPSSTDKRNKINFPF